MANSIRSYAIPPIIDDMLRKLQNPSLPVHERDNLATTLEEIERAIQAETLAHRKARVRDFEEDRREKKTARAGTKRR